MKRTRRKRRRLKTVPPQPASEQLKMSMAEAWERFDAILAEIDQIPDLPHGADPLEWDEHGLPR